MSAVIEFPATRIRKADCGLLPGPADIIIFPGVRVERLAFDLAERLPAKRTGSQAPARLPDLDFY